MLALVVGLSGPAQAQAPVGAGFHLNNSDLRFILDQIHIAEAHAAGGPLLGDGPNQVPRPDLSFGLRTVDGRDNNLQPGQRAFGASDIVFPRLSDPLGLFRDAEALTIDPDGPGGQAVGDATTYKSKRGFVEDSQPRQISNAVVDQTSTNPSAVAAAGAG